ncbi:glycerophosphodiester phosphodiesterase family protein [Microlunatus flavus]|uniref:glycerophosphodiester phosphodiesterase n=1 Tax=Microlunatus flavus TaxID=1036181 RepID=A0A1H9AMH8_9ACTN|nr:glycerophosphodiester phosphodiesterase family protein [Microlunatus flavus]SEP78022.1 glycerophosphoryl diester phosphodiesterase [Microlunatus flavus]
MAHRGASGYLPEHTLAAYELAFAQGADVVEPDLVMTADGVLVVRHENEIGETTDVARRPRFADRRTTKVVDGHVCTGWFAEDFTLEELKTLRAVERLPHLRPGSSAFDGAFGLVTFDELLQLAARSRTTDGRPVGLLVEVKHATYLGSIGLDPVPAILAALEAAGHTSVDAPVMLQSFETTCLRRLAEQSDVRIGQLVEVCEGPYDQTAAGTPQTWRDLLSAPGLAEISRYADAVGLEKELIIPRDADGWLLAPSPVTHRAHDVGLEVFGWTFRGENGFLPLDFRRGSDPSAQGDLAGEIAVHLAAGMDSVITDHPDLARIARHEKVLVAA